MHCPGRLLCCDFLILNLVVVLEVFFVIWERDVAVCDYSSISGILYIEKTDIDTSLLVACPCLAVSSLHSTHQGWMSLRFISSLFFARAGEYGSW